MLTEVVVKFFHMLFDHASVSFDIGFVVIHEASAEGIELFVATTSR